MLLISRSKNKSFPNKNQVFSETNLMPSAEVLANPLSLQHLLIQCEKTILNYILHQRMIHACMYYSQARIARMTGYSRETVNRSIKKLVSLGLLHKMYRHKSTCIYTTSPWFANISVRQTLTKILPALYMGISLLLLLAQNTHSNEHITQVKNKNIYISSQTSTKRAESAPSTYGFSTLSIKDNTEPWYDDDNLALPADIRSQFEHKEYESRKIQEKFHLNLGMKMHKVSDEASIMLLNGFTGFKMTVAGTARLTPFPAEALAFAEENTSKMTDKTPQELFEAFYELCKTYCIIYRITPPYDQEQSLLKLYNLPSNSAYVEHVAPKVSKPIAIQSKPSEKKHVYEKNTYKPRYTPKNNRYQQQEQASCKTQEWQEKKTFVEEDPFEAALKIERYRLTEDGLLAEVRLGIVHNPWFLMLDETKKNEVMRLYPKAADHLKQKHSRLSGLSEAIVLRASQLPKNSYEDNMLVAKEYANGKKQEIPMNNAAQEEAYASDESPYDFIPPFDMDDGTSFDFI